MKKLKTTNKKGTASVLCVQHKNTTLLRGGGGNDYRIVFSNCCVHKFCTKRAHRIALHIQMKYSFVCLNFYGAARKCCANDGCHRANQSQSHIHTHHMQAHKWNREMLHFCSFYDISIYFVVFFSLIRL